MSNSKFSLGLIGYPLTYSLSPDLHNAALEAMNLKGQYRNYPIPPFPEGEQDLLELLALMREGEITGLNVTIPHKQTVIPYLDELTPTAKVIGAVNTIIVDNGKLIGENTDAPGFISDLNRFLIEALGDNENLLRNRMARKRSKSSLILGGGGAARAVAYAQVRAGWTVTIAARRLEQANEIIDSFLSKITDLMPTEENIWSSSTSGSLRAVHLDESSIAKTKSNIIINATPVGMWPEVSKSPWPEEVPFPTGAFVYDLIYHPTETALLRSARAAGLNATNGLGMLIEQAALALEIWTGQMAPREILWRTAARLSGSEIDKASEWKPIS